MMLVIAGLGMILVNKKAHLALAVVALVYVSAYYAIEYFEVIT